MRGTIYSYILVASKVSYDSPSDFGESYCRFCSLVKWPLIIKGPRYVMNTHMDTVPPYIPPTHDGIRVSGRGANDAKGLVFAM